MKLVLEQVEEACSSSSGDNVMVAVGLRIDEEERETARALGTPAAGLRPRPARGKGFPSNLLLFFRFIHLISLYREVYLTPKQAVINLNGLRPNKPLTPLTLHPT